MKLEINLVSVCERETEREREEGVRSRSNLIREKSRNGEDVPEFSDFFRE